MLTRVKGAPHKDPHQEQKLSTQIKTGVLIKTCLRNVQIIMNIAIIPLLKIIIRNWIKDQAPRVL